MSAEVETQEDQIVSLEDELRKSERKVRQLKAEVAHLKVSVPLCAILNRSDPSQAHIEYLVANAPKSKAYQDKYRKFLAEHKKQGA